MMQGLGQDPMGSKWLTGDSNSGLFGVKARSKSKGQRATAWGQRATAWGQRQGSASGGTRGESLEGK